MQQIFNFLKKSFIRASISNHETHTISPESECPIHLFSRPPCAKAATGFTLVELMIVVVILGLLAGAVVVNVSGYIGKSRRERARMDVASLRNAVELFNLQYSRFPTNEEGLDILTQRSTEQPLAFISELPKDPWGNPYVYLCPGQHGAFDIMSLGRDGAQGGEGQDADIVSWQLADGTNGKDK